MARYSFKSYLRHWKSALHSTHNINQYQLDVIAGIVQISTLKALIQQNWTRCLKDVKHENAGIYNPICI